MRKKTIRHANEVFVLTCQGHDKIVQNILRQIDAAARAPFATRSSIARNQAKPTRRNTMAEPVIKMVFTAKDALTTAHNSKHSPMEKIEIAIEKAAKKGNLNLTYDIASLSPVVQRVVIDTLKKRGYAVDYVNMSATIQIDWSNPKEIAYG